MTGPVGQVHGPAQGELDQLPESSGAARPGGTRSSAAALTTDL
ncbi:hypothetical protein ACWGIU_22825 [Streptomyces sp. NPDC054840]